METLSDGDTTQLLMGGEMLARHLIATEDHRAGLKIAVDMDEVVELGIQHKRYKLLLVLMNCADTEARELLERSLDAEIAKREQNILLVN